MKALVLIERVEDPELKIKIRPDGTDIDTTGLRYVVNPFDEVALEEALRLRTAHGGEVVVVAVGPREAAQQLRTALATGADNAILVWHDLPRLDALAKARALAHVVQMEQPNLVLLGKQAIDDDMGQIGPLLAELLGWGLATLASKEESLESAAEKSRQPALHLAGERIEVVREVDGGLARVSVALPAVITTELRLNTPRYPTLPGIMQAKKKPVREIELTTLAVDTSPCQRVTRMEAPKTRQAGVLVDSVAMLLDKLRHEAKVL